ncbi:predicted protein [Postia placenta Mad-698-R]|nr:predicted protein [Postia placenta Mad-698-R]
MLCYAVNASGETCVDHIPKRTAPLQQICRAGLDRKATLTSHKLCVICHADYTCRDQSEIQLPHLAQLLSPLTLVRSPDHPHCIVNHTNLDGHSEPSKSMALHRSSATPAGCTECSSHNDYYYFTMFRKPERKVTVNMHGPIVFMNPGDFQQFYAQMGRMVDDERDSDDEEAGVQNVKNEARLPQQSDKKDKAPGPCRIQQVTTDTHGIWPAKTLLKPKGMSIASQAAKAAPQRATAPKEPHTFPMPPRVQQAAPVQTSLHPIWKPPVSPPPKADSGVKSMHGDFQGWQYWPGSLLADGNFKEMKYEERHYWDGGERVQSARLEVRRPATMAAGTEDGRRPAWQKPSGQ